MNFRIPPCVGFAATAALDARPMKKLFLPAFQIFLLSLAVCLPAGAAVYDRTSVCSYGAIPNDGLPDTTAINNAVLSGRSIYFPPGTYIYGGTTPITLTANRSYRIYGDGPGVATIIFTGTNGGISANAGVNTLNVEGLTLQANCAGGGACGTAINAVFGPNSFPNTKIHHATIHNVQIIGSTRDGSTGSYWTTGIYLYKAQNSFIDKVEIAGNKNYTQTGIFWESDPNPDPNTGDAATGMQMSNLQIKWCNTALRTAGWIEGLYVTGFEFFSCGRGLPGFATPAVDLHSINNANRKPAFHLVNGRVDMIGEGVKVTDLTEIKISNVRFTHLNPDAINATMLNFTNCLDVLVSECTFYGVNPNSGVAAENGIWLDNADYVRIFGNNFRNMRPANGNCIVIKSTSEVVRITDNVFTNVTGLYVDERPPNDVWYFGNSPPP